MWRFWHEHVSLQQGCQNIDDIFPFLHVGTRTPCYHNGGCSDECAVQNNTKVCLCPEGKILVDGYRCISTPLNEECKNKSDQFVCSDGKDCIHIESKCDGENDCNDESDESSVVCCE